MNKERKLTEHSNPRKSFGVSPKKVRHDANTREAEDEIRSFENGEWGHGDYVRNLQEPQPKSKLD